MSGSLNKVQLIGRVGKESEIRSTHAGKEIASLSLATSESWKDRSSGERKEKTEWHNIVIFNENLVAVVKNYVTKGMLLYVEGALQTRKWQDRDGNDRYSTEVVLQGFNATLTMLSSSKVGDSDSDDAPPATKPSARPAAIPLDDSEIPF